MEKRVSRFFIILLVALMLFSSVSCGKKSSKTAQSASYDEEAKEMYFDRGASYGTYAVMDAAPMMAEAPMLSSKKVASTNAAASVKVGGNGAIQTNNVQNLNVKLIYRANLSIQTLDYSETYNTLSELVESYGGYFESAYKYNGSMDSKTHPYGNYSIRIPSEKYTQFINKIGTSTHLVDLEQSVEDVSQTYSDIEQRLETLKTKHERLITLLAGAKDMKDIISLENALSECESELDRYSSRKKNYDSLIGYSTIRLNLTEVERLEPSVPEKPETFAQKLGKAVKRGFNRAVDSVANFIIWFLSHILGIIFWCAVFVLAYVLSKKVKNRMKAKREAKLKELPEEDE